MIRGIHRTTAPIDQHAYHRVDGFFLGGAVQFRDGSSPKTSHKMIHAEWNGDVMKFYVVPNKETVIHGPLTKGGMRGTFHSIPLG